MTFNGGSIIAASPDEAIVHCVKLKTEIEALVDAITKFMNVTADLPANKGNTLENFKKGLDESVSLTNKAGEFVANIITPFKVYIDQVQQTTNVAAGFDE